MKSYIYILIGFTLLNACVTDPEKELLKPESTGKLAEIILMTNKQYAAEYKNLLTPIFNTPIPGFPPPGEPSFKVQYTDESFFKGYFKKHHNIFVFITKDKMELFEPIFGKAILTSLLKNYQKNPDLIGIKQHNLFAKNQTVFFVLSEDKNSMIRKIEESNDQFLNIALKHENKSGAQKLFGTGKRYTDAFSKRMLKEKYFTVQRPSTYRIAIENDDFVWLRKVSSVKEQQFGILMFETKYKDTSDLSLQTILAVRNSYTKKYIPGEIKGSYMKFSSAIEPIYRVSKLDRRYTIDINGWWDVQGDFMGGPSHIRVILDEKRNRLIYVEGFLFYPNEAKATSMREIDQILNSIIIR